MSDFYLPLLIRIGGDLPESKLQQLLGIIDEGAPSDRTVEELHISFRDGSTELVCTTHTTDETNYISFNGIEEFCENNNLEYLKRIPPHLAHNCITYYNETCYLWRPGMSECVVVPTDGEEAVCLVKNVLNIIQDVFYSYEQVPEDQVPLKINDQDLPGYIAKQRLAGEPLRKILTDIIRRDLGYPDLSLIPFRIIGGK